MMGNLDILDNKKRFNKKNFSYVNWNYINFTYIVDFHGYINDKKFHWKMSYLSQNLKKKLLSFDYLTYHHFKTVFFYKNNKNYVFIYN